MFIQNRLEDAAVSIISGSLAANSITNWQLYKGMGTDGITFPCIKVICHQWEPLYKELNLGVGKAYLEIITCGVKAIGDAGQGTSATEFETVSDYAFNPFLKNNAMQGATNNLQIFLVSDDGLDVETLTDGWTAKQKLEVICSRTS